MIADRFYTRIAWMLWGLVMILASVSLVFRLWNISEVMASLDGAEAFSEILWWGVLVPAAVPAYATVGVVVASRRASNGIGWLCLVVGLIFAPLDITWQWAARALDIDPGSLPAGVQMAWVATVLFAFQFLPFTLALLIFPDGHLLSRRWRVVAWMAVAGAAIGVLALITDPTLFFGATNPTSIEGLVAASEVVSVGAFVVVVLTLLVSVASVFIRWRGSRGDERQQLKWLAYVGAVIAVALLCGIVSGLAFGFYSYPTVLIFGVAIGGITIGIPLSIGVAILEYRLYDVDLVINRTLVYVTLSATLGMIYAGSVVLLQRTFVFLTGEGSQLAVVVSTLAIAALFNPLRRRVQAFVDRRFYRSRYDSRKVLEDFSRRLGSQTDIEALKGDLHSVVRETVRPTHVSVWLKPPGDGDRRRR